MATVPGLLDTAARTAIVSPGVRKYTMVQLPSKSPLGGKRCSVKLRIT